MPCEECDAEWAIISFFLILTECFRVVVEKLVGLLGIAVNFLDLDAGEGKEKLVFFALSRKVGRQFYLLASACLYHTALMCPSHGWIGWDSSAIAMRHPRLWSFLCFLFPVWFMHPLDSLQHPRILIVRAIFVTPLSFSDRVVVWWWNVPVPLWSIHRFVPARPRGCVSWFGSQNQDRPKARGPWSVPTWTSPRILSTIRFVRMSTDTAQDGVTVSCCPAWEQAGEGGGERGRGTPSGNLRST